MAASNPYRFLRKHPDFARYASAFQPVQFGSQIEAVAIGWQDRKSVV